MIKPNFFIVGAPKSGTSALAHYLSGHPRVFFAQPKEPFYWCQDFRNSKAIHSMHEMDRYMQLFSQAIPSTHLAVGEGSTTYLQSQVALPAIKKFNPDAKIIVMLRNPIEMVVGMHGELLRHGFEDQVDFATAWDLQLARSQGRNLPRNLAFDHQLQYRDVARYPVQLSRLFDTFPPSQRLVVLFDDFRENTADIYRRVLQFLDLPDDGRNEFPIVHPAKAIRYSWLAKLQSNPPPLVRRSVESFKAWYYGSQGTLKKTLQKWMFRQASRAPISLGTKSLLADTFRDDIGQLSSMVDRDLSSWCVDANI